jgi:NTE family protein
MKLPYDRVALVLQGGGALGAYQGGVFEGLTEAGIECDWAAGISIGAINAALIAGNPPAQRVERLREFWDTVTAPPLLPPTAAWWANALESGGAASRTALGWFEASRALLEGQRGFFVPRVPSPAFSTQSAPGELSHYDTAPLVATLERLVDFDRINHKKGLRLTVSAVNIESGNFELFDSQRGPWAGRITPAHIVASGALPPGFAAVEIEGQHYWDGGLVSNTPLATVLDEEPRRDTVAFQVDLWSALGPLPKNLLDVEERAKDIRFSSRTRAVTRQLERERHLRRLLREVLARVVCGSAGTGVRQDFQRRPPDLSGEVLGQPPQGLRVQCAVDARPLGQRPGRHPAHAGASGLAGAARAVANDGHARRAPRPPQSLRRKR